MFLPYNPGIVVQNIDFTCYSELFNDHQPNGIFFYERYIDSFNIKENIFILNWHWVRNELCNYTLWEWILSNSVIAVSKYTFCCDLYIHNIIYKCTILCICCHFEKLILLISSFIIWQISCVDLLLLCITCSVTNKIKQ